MSCNTKKPKPDMKALFTAFCGDFDTKDDTYPAQRPRTSSFMGFCADCDKMQDLNTIITHRGVKKNVCVECLKHYSLRFTKIERPRWAGVFL